MSNLPDNINKDKDQTNKEITNVGQGGKLSNIKKGSLRDRIAQSQQAQIEQEVNAFTCQNRIALLEDCSGSMGGSKEKNLQEAIESFISNCDFSDTALVHVPFGLNNTYEDESNYIAALKFKLTNNESLLRAFIPELKATGSTPLGEFMQKALEENPLTRTIIISDGQPTDISSGWDYENNKPPEQLCIKIAKKYKEADIPVDCVHIGSEKSGEEILKMIAEITGGIYIKFTDPSIFSQKFHYLSPVYRALLNSPQTRQQLLGDKK